MEAAEILQELKAVLVERLKFDGRRVSDLGMETPLPKGLEGSLGLDSLDFIELAIAIEQRLGLAMDETEDLAPHFQSLGTLVAYLTFRMVRG